MSETHEVQFKPASTHTAGLSFSAALESVKKGWRIARTGWNGKDMYVELQTPDTHSKMSLPYLYMKTADGQLVPWLASQTDLLANDWFTITR